MNHLQVIILAIIEGITEFLPISSTGHMIIASSVMGIADNEFVKTFTVGIQFGAILSVVVLYYKRFVQSIDFYVKLFLAFLPAAIVGYLFGNQIDKLLGNVRVVAVCLIIGGVILLFIDRLFKPEDKNEKEPGYFNAIRIGLFQAIAVIPGVSRSAASIVGGLSQKLTREKAAEFSFFLAVPTMFVATAYKMFKYQFSISYPIGWTWRELFKRKFEMPELTKNIGFTRSEIHFFLLGNVIAFLVAMLVIKWFIGFLTKHGFYIFGWYRIIVGAVILILLAMGHDLKVL